MPTYTTGYIYVWFFFVVLFCFVFYFPETFLGGEFLINSSLHGLIPIYWAMSINKLFVFP